MTASWVSAVYPLADTSTDWASTRPEFGVTLTGGRAPAGAATSPDVTVVAIIETTTKMSRFTVSPCSCARHRDEYAARGLAHIEVQDAWSGSKVPLRPRCSATVRRCYG